jgi:hypothetical protein
MISSYVTFIKRFATKRGTTLLQNPTFASCNINDLQPKPTLQLLKISQSSVIDHVAPLPWARSGIG